MRKTPPKRLGKALEHAGGLAEQIAASLPPPKPKRGRRVMVAWSEEEYARIEAFAQERDEPLAVVVRNLTVAALEAMGR